MVTSFVSIRSAPALDTQANPVGIPVSPHGEMAFPTFIGELHVQPGDVRFTFRALMCSSVALEEERVGQHRRVANPLIGARKSSKTLTPMPI